MTHRQGLRAWRVCSLALGSLHGASSEHSKLPGRSGVCIGWVEFTDGWGKSVCRAGLG